MSTICHRTSLELSTSGQFGNAYIIHIATSGSCFIPLLKKWITSLLVLWVHNHMWWRLLLAIMSTICIHLVWFVYLKNWGEMLPIFFYEVEYSSGAIDVIWIKHS